MGERDRAARRAGLPRRALRWGAAVASAAAALLLAAWGGYALRPRPVEPVPGVDDKRSEDPDGGPIAKLIREVGEPAAARERGTIDVSVMEDPDRAEVERLLRAAERIFISLKNADPTDHEEMTALRGAVLDTALVARLTEARKSMPEGEPLLVAARAVERILLRIANGDPKNAEEFREIKALVTDSAVTERTMSARLGM
jgi:hypothetical protein